MNEAQTLSRKALAAVGAAKPLTIAKARNHAGLPLSNGPRLDMTELN